MRRPNQTRYAVHTHIGVFWDGGVRLLGVYRWFWAARLHCWWHVRVENPYRIGTVRKAHTRKPLENYQPSEQAWEAEMKLPAMD